MTKNYRLWSLLIIVLMVGLLFLNYSNKIDYIKLADWKPNPSGGAIIKCSNFSTQQEAQSFFEENGGPAIDKYNLDGDNDGQVCEGLP